MSDDESYVLVRWRDAFLDVDVWEALPVDARQRIRDAFDAAGYGVAQRLHDEGLVFAINRLVLHPLGLAIGFHANVEDEENRRGRVKGLFLRSTGDDSPIEFDDAAVKRNLSKLRAAGHHEVASMVEAQDELRAREGDDGR